MRIDSNAKYGKRLVSHFFTALWYLMVSRREGLQLDQSPLLGFIKRNDLLSLAKVQMPWLARGCTFREDINSNKISLWWIIGVQWRAGCFRGITWVWWSDTPCWSIGVPVFASFWMSWSARAVVLRYFLDFFLMKSRWAATNDCKAATARECLQMLLYLCRPHTHVAWSL